MKLFLRFAFISAVLLVSVFQATIAHAQAPADGRPVCPNNSPFPNPQPDGNPCPPRGGGGGDAGGGSGDGGPSNCDAAGGAGGVGPSAGDPISIAHGDVNRVETDFAIPVKYGLTLESKRLYTSSAFGIDPRINAGESLFSYSWYSPYEMRMYSSTIPGMAYMYYDEFANIHHFEATSTTGVFEARLDQGSPQILTVAGSGSSTTYTVQRSDLTELGFDDEGKLDYIEANFYTATQERLTFDYDGTGHLSHVYAPSGDDRYLEYNYNSIYRPDNVTSIDLKTSSETYPLAFYYYNGSATLAYVFRHGDATGSAIYYEYGSFDRPSTTDVFTSGPNLGRVSYYMDGDATVRPVVAYTYFNITTSIYLGGTLSVNKQWNYDYNAVTPRWKHILTYNGTNWSHNPYLYYGDGSYGDPITYYRTSYQADLDVIEYSGAGSAMPPTDLLSPGSLSLDLGRPRLYAEMRRQDNTATWYPLWRHNYDTSNSDYILKYRLLSQQKFFDTTGGSDLTTSYEYNDSNYELYPTDVISPTGMTSSTTFYSTPSNKAGKASASAFAGKATYYDYDSDGLLASVTRDGLTTDYTYDSRGNATIIDYPDGSQVTRTYNDFGQTTSETTTHLGTSYFDYSDQSTYHDSTTVASGDQMLPPRLLRVTSADGNTAYFAYDSEDNVTSSTDFGGKTSQFVYNKRGLLETRENAAHDVETFGYDIHDHLVSFKDGRNKETSYEHDIFGRTTKETDPDGFYKEYSYTDGALTSGGCGSCSGGGASLVSSVRLQDNTYVYFVYDLAGRLTKLDYDAVGTTGSYELIYTYDDESRVTSVLDNRLTLSGDQTYHFDYDEIGRVVKITHPEGYTQEYMYQDDDGEDFYRLPIAYKDVDGHVVKYGYDALEHLASITDGYGDDTVYTYATTSDSAYPVGAVKRTTYGNSTKNDYAYDALGRLDKVEYLSGSNSVFDYVDLAYDAAGMITEKKRKDSSSYFTTFYDYDDAYRLTEEKTKNGSSTVKTTRGYGYDAAGNRTSMTFSNDASVSKSTSYTYGNREQIVSNDGYLREGTTDSGAMTYTWDAKGNMLTRTGQTLEWNEDNRLTKVWVSGGDPKAELFQKFFKYDYAGRRILEYKNTDGVRTRSFFNGLTEEIKKVSVGTGADTSFARTVKLTSDSSESSAWTFFGSRTSHVWDADRFSQVTRDVNEESSGKTWWESGDGWNITGKRTFALWAKGATGSSAQITICVKATDGNRYGLYYFGSTGSPSSYGSVAYFPLGGTSQNFVSGKWTRLERDIQADLTASFGKTLSCVTGIYIWSGGTSSPYLYIDDVSFSNSLTVEHNTLGGGSIGHILRHTEINPSSYAQASRWFHYDQVGSVMAESDASGVLAQTHYQDAFGNTQASWSTGLWGGDQAGWHHNTKEHDIEIDLEYSYSRWRKTSVSLFISKNSVSQKNESSYNFAAQGPVRIFDPTGNDISMGVQGTLGGINPLYHSCVVIDNPNRPGWVLRYDFAMRWGPNINREEAPSLENALDNAQLVNKILLTDHQNRIMHRVLELERKQDPNYTGFTNCQTWASTMMLIGETISNVPDPTPDWTLF